jgi:hypothetical protein
MLAHMADQTDFSALEAFVAENEDLLTLEERVGRFNIFDALGIVRRELQHSNFLAWLLDPNESHGQGDVFLAAVLMELFRCAPSERRPFSPVFLDGAELRGVEVRREWRSIDLLVVCDEPPFVVAIENKVDSGEHSGQLQRYAEVVKAEWPDRKALFVFLTPRGLEPSDDGWTTWSYEDLHRVLLRVRRTGAGAIGGDVGAFLDHYLNLLEGRMMDDPKIAELCKRIYKNHRRAIDLIYEHAQVGSAGTLTALGELIDNETDGDGIYHNRTGRWLRFTPTEWIEASPPLAVEIRDPRASLVYEIYADANRFVRVTLVVCPSSDQQWRNALIERLTRDPSEFGLRRRGKATEKWTRVFSAKAYAWADGEEPDPELAAQRSLEAFRKLRRSVIGVGAAIREVANNHHWKQVKSTATH